MDRTADSGCASWWTAAGAAGELWTSHPELHSSLSYSYVHIPPRAVTASCDLHEAVNTRIIDTGDFTRAPHDFPHEGRQNPPPTFPHHEGRLKVFCLKQAFHYMYYMNDVYVTNKHSTHQRLFTILSEITLHAAPHQVRSSLVLSSLNWHCSVSVTCHCLPVSQFTSAGSSSHSDLCTVNMPAQWDTNLSKHIEPNSDQSRSSFMAHIKWDHFLLLLPIYVPPGSLLSAVYIYSRPLTQFPRLRFQQAVILWNLLPRLPVFKMFTSNNNSSQHN